MFVALVGEGPTYLRLYRGLRDAIVDGRLPATSALPSTRELAEKLELSRNTVLRAYEQLIAEGFATARHGGGTYVAEHVVAPAAPVRETATFELSPSGQRVVAAMIANPFVQLGLLPPVAYDFLFGVPDAGLFPLAEWRKLTSRAVDRATKRTLSYDHPAGLARLREMVAAHLVRHRGVRCDAQQVLITSGAQQAFDLIARMLVREGDRVLVEDPCYPAVRALITAAGARAIPAPVDDEGVNLDGVDGCRVAFVTPSHQFPSGAIMSAPRRRALLDWAARAGALIVEDDYDGDYRHTGAPIQSLQGLDAGGRVIHVGTFSKSLFPSLRLAYMVVPPALVGPMCAAKWIADWSSPLLSQQVLADFMSGGHFMRHLKRSSAVYARRRDALLAAVQRKLPGAVVKGGDAGMHLVVWLPDVAASKLDAVVGRARSLGVGVYPISAFYERAPDHAGLVLGYSGLSEREIEAGITLLAKALA